MTGLRALARARHGVCSVVFVFCPTEPHPIVIFALLVHAHEVPFASTARTLNSNRCATMNELKRAVRPHPPFIGVQILFPPFFPFPFFVDARSAATDRAKKHQQTTNERHELKKHDVQHCKLAIAPDLYEQGELFRL